MGVVDQFPKAAGNGGVTQGDALRLSLGVEQFMDVEIQSLAAGEHAIAKAQL